jgi:GNAT superfamily N-acetyltransferase
MISIEPFAREHVEDAARRFIRTYQDERRRIRCLPQAYENPGTIAHLLEEVLARNPGVAAISNGGLAGYLIGYSDIPDFKGISPGAYIPEWGHSAETKEVFQKMYDTMAHAWIHDGCFTHAITFFESDAAMRDTLYCSGFGLLVIDVIREVKEHVSSGEDELDPGIMIRAADEGDLDELARLDNELVTYLSRSPTFLYSEGKEEFDAAKAFLEEDTISIVAERDRRVLSCIRGRIRQDNACTIVRDPSVMGIDFAYTDPDVRGTGLGRRILRDVLEWGASKGKTGCAVDFESANVLGRRFWLEHFKTVCLSAIRHVDPRVAQTR